MHKVNAKGHIEVSGFHTVASFHCQAVKENHLQFDPFHWRHQNSLPSCVQSLSCLQRAWGEMLRKI